MTRTSCKFTCILFPGFAKLFENLTYLYRGIDGVTPLHIAVAWNRSVIVRLLLSYGADPWILDDSEKNSFHYAYEEQAWDALKTLEIFRRTQNMDSFVNEKKNYSIQLGKFTHNI